MIETTTYLPYEGDIYNKYDRLMIVFRSKMRLRLSFAVFL